MLIPTSNSVSINLIVAIQFFNFSGYFSKRKFLSKDRAMSVDRLEKMIWIDSCRHQD
jgi:hypothetical protein